MLPSKRTRTEADESDPPPPSILPAPQVKRERSPSLPLVEKRLITRGTKRFAPIPDDCLLSCTDYRRNRLEWVARCVKESEALNLIPERRLFRDDGLIIDWRSHVPVWSDTLKPEPQDLAATIMLTHRSNAQWHPSPNRKESPQKSMTTIPAQKYPLSISDAEPPLKKRLPVPPRPSSKHRQNPLQSIPADAPPSTPGSSFPYPEGPRLSNETAHETYSVSGGRISSLSDCTSVPTDITSPDGQTNVPPKPHSRPGGQSVVPDVPPTAEEEMSEMTLNYLRRYVQAYESDRASLASAYASNASFGYRIQHINEDTRRGSSTAGTGSPRCTSSSSKRSRLDIVTTLLTLPSLHLKGSNLSIAQIQYDIFYLGAKLGMFVRKEMNTEDAATEGVWPLTAAAHQILVFQT